MGLITGLSLLAVHSAQAAHAFSENTSSLSVFREQHPLATMAINITAIVVILGSCVLAMAAASRNSNL